MMRRREHSLERQVNRPLAPYVIEGHLDDFTNAVLVDMVHGETLDVCGRLINCCLVWSPLSLDATRAE